MSPRAVIYLWLRKDEGLTDGAKDLLEEAFRSPIGRRIGLAAQMDADLEAGLTVTLDELPADEHALIRVLRAERTRHQEEKIEEERLKSL